MPAAVPAALVRVESIDSKKNTLTQAIPANLAILAKRYRATIKDNISDNKA
jgi:hypothetical protein